MTVRLHFEPEIKDLHHLLLHLIVDNVPFEEFHTLGWWESNRLKIPRMWNRADIISELRTIKRMRRKPFFSSSMLKIAGNLARAVVTKA